MLKLISPFPIANQFSVRSAFHIRVQNCGMLFQLKCKHQKLIIHSNSISEMPPANVDSLFHSIYSIALVFSLATCK